VTGQECMLLCIHAGADCWCWCWDCCFAMPAMSCCAFLKAQPFQLSLDSGGSSSALGGAKLGREAGKAVE
jgi:hypothetical protein